MHFEHDCLKCLPLGEHDGCDLYYCPSRSLGGSVISRFGAEGHEYASGPLEVLFYADLKGTYSGGLVEGFRRVLKDHISFDFAGSLERVEQLWADVSAIPEIREWRHYQNGTKPVIDKLLEDAQTETDPHRQVQIVYAVCKDLRMYGEDIRYELGLKVNDKEITLVKQEVIPLEER
jgi:hypothetical protein